MRERSQRVRSILLFGTESNLALPAIRGLHDAFPDARIHALSPQKERIKVPEGSRFISSRNVFEASLEDQAGLITELKEVVKRTASQVVVPIEEKYVEFLAAHQEEISEFVQLPPLSKPEALHKLTYKNKLSNTLKEIGLPFAPTEEITNDRVPEDRWEEYPCVLKPVHAYSGYGVSVIESEGEVAERLQEGERSEYVRHEEGYVLQQWIPGYNIDCSLIAEGGQIRVLTMQKAIGDPGMTFSKSIHLLHSDEIRDYVRKLISKTGFSGVAHLDFRYDERTDEIILIDFNARVWSSLMGSAAVGVNFMEYLVKLAAGIPFDEPGYEDAAYHMGAETVKAIWARLRSGGEQLQAYYDLKYRLTDPIPEIMNIWYRFSSRYIDYTPN